MPCPYLHHRVACALLVAPLVLLAGCGEGRGAGGGPGSLGPPVVSDSAGVTVVVHPAGLFAEGAVAPAPFASDFTGEPEVRIGVAEGDEAYQLTNPAGGARLSDGRIVILDAQSRTLRFFTADGIHERTVGRTGDGPGEFRTARQLLHLGGDTLAAFDLLQQRIHIRAPDGSLVREHTLREPEFSGRGARIAPGAGGALYVVGMGTLDTGGGGLPDGPLRPDALLHRVEADGSVARVASFPGEESVMQVTGQSGGMQMVAILNWWFLPNLLSAPAPGLEGVWHADGVTWEVALRGEEGSPTRLVRFSDPLEPFTPELLARIHQDELDRAANPETRDRVRESQSDRAYPVHVPPIRDLWSDQLGRLWVGPTDPPVRDLPAGLGRDQRFWLVLDPDGGVVGSVRLPPRSRPLWASDEGILLVRLDDLNLPAVEWWPARG
jgi:hypothetical protein